MFEAPLEYGVTFWRNLRVSQAFFLGGSICLLSSSVQASVAKSQKLAHCRLRSVLKKLMRLKQLLKASGFSASKT